MHYLRRLYSRFARWPHALAALLLLAIVLHSGTTLNGGLYADDYIHWAYFEGNAELEAKGLLSGIGAGEFWPLLKNQFSFFDPEIANYQAMVDFGILPWWTDETAKLHFFRPLATLTHYLDYELWPDSPKLMHLMNLLWYLAGLIAIYTLYRGTGLHKSVALFALALVILDNSIFHVITWIASRSMLMVIAFGFFSVYAYHMSVTAQHKLRWYLASLVGLILTIFSAEGGIAICAYLGAYMFCMEDRPWAKRLLHLLPFVLVTLVWRAYYQTEGFGAYNLDFYIDPGHNPAAFIERALILYPSNLFELVMGIDVMGGQIRHDLKYVFAGISILICLIIVWLLWTPLKENRVLRFYGLATLFSLVPGLTIVLSTRTMVIPFIGFSVILSYVFYQWATAALTRLEKVTSYVIMSYTLLMHVLLAFVIAAYMTVSILDFSGDGEMDRGVKDFGVEDYADKPVVFVNSLKPFWLAFLGHELAYQDQALPANIRVLSSAFYPITVSRPNEKTLVLTADPAFQFDSQPILDLSNEPAGHFAYLTQHLMGLIRSKHSQWHTGIAKTLPEMNIYVDKLYAGKPSQVRVELTQPLNDYRWAYYDFDTNAYETFTLPNVGDTILLQGLFPTNKPVAQ